MKLEKEREKKRYKVCLNKNNNKKHLVVVGNSPFYYILHSFIEKNFYKRERERDCRINSGNNYDILITC